MPRFADRARRAPDSPCWLAHLFPGHCTGIGASAASKCDAPKPASVVRWIADRPPSICLSNEQTHPKGVRARVLLSSVFGPYAQDDEFGSRTINPMELYHNQVTRAQGSFSVRRFHRSWGILMIQENISAPCTVLDFPTREAFARELKAHLTTSWAYLRSS